MAATTTDAENLTCVFTVIFADDTKTVLAVLPSKSLPRPRKDGNGTTKGLAKPWMLPGGKREKGESSITVAARTLQEKTGLQFTDLAKTLLKKGTATRMKATIYLYSVPGELPVVPGEGIEKVAWVPLEEAEGLANFPMITGLRCVSGPRWLSDFGTLKLHSETDIAALRAESVHRGVTNPDQHAARELFHRHLERLADSDSDDEQAAKKARVQ